VARNLLEGNNKKTNFLVRRASYLPYLSWPRWACSKRMHDGRDRSSRSTSRYFELVRGAQPCAAFEVLMEEGSGRILSVHLLGP
jgi:hypothetical protein